jgi:peptide chain release factor subunit 3
LVVLVNKMDSVGWDIKRYKEIVDKLTPFLKKWGFNMKTDVVFIPASGFRGINIKDPITKEICAWAEPNQSLFQVLDSFKAPDRDYNGPVRIPIMAKYKDMGATFILGKVGLICCCCLCVFSFLPFLSSFFLSWKLVRSTKVKN